MKTEPRNLVVAAYFLDVVRGAQVTLERVGSRSGVDRWVIRQKLYNFCLNKSGMWEYEAPPSWREAAFFDRTRFATVEEALAVWDARKEPQ